MVLFIFNFYWFVITVQYYLGWLVAFGWAGAQILVELDCEKIRPNFRVLKEEKKKK